MSVISLDMERKTYRKRSAVVTILEEFTLEVCQGERVAIIGESGVGKSSLLNILGLIDRRFSGTYLRFGRDVADLSDRGAASLRNDRIGFVLQESALINTLTIADNIRLPLLYARQQQAGGGGNFDRLVDSLGIAPILKKTPVECSGGEKARAVFARGVIMNPHIVLADEPTASLDAENKAKVLDLLLGLNREHGTTVITVTHDMDVANQHDRVVALKKRM